MDFYLTPLYFFGLIAVGAYAIRRFNEPSFPNNEALPSTTEPLRYLFLKREYRRARLTYVVASLILYTALIWPGPSIVPKLGIVGLKEADTDTWALIVALVLVGVMPNISVKWLGLVEENLRRVIHSRFLVPDGTIRMIELLKYAHYEPRASLLSSLSEIPPRQPSPRPAGSAEHAFPSLGTGDDADGIPSGSSGRVRHIRSTARPSSPLRRISTRSRNVTAFSSSRSTPSTISGRRASSRRRSADRPRRCSGGFYAYINWGIRHKANTEGEVTQTLEDSSASPFRRSAIGASSTSYFRRLR